MWSPEAGKKFYIKKNKNNKKEPHLTFTFHPFAGSALRGRFLHFLACWVIWPVSNFKSIGQGVRGLRLPKFGGFPLTLHVALTTLLRTNVLHCDYLICLFFSYCVLHVMHAMYVMYVCLSCDCYHLWWIKIYTNRFVIYDLLKAINSKLVTFAPERAI